MKSEQERLRLFWSSRSPYVRAVMLAIHELGIVDQIEMIDTLVTGMMPVPELEVYNPLGRIPALVLSDGTSLVETFAIIEYLDTRHGSTILVPSDYPERRDVLQRFYLAMGICDRAMLLIRETFRPEAHQMAEMIKGLNRSILLTLDEMTKRAEKWETNRIDLGDIAMAAALGYLDFRFSALNWRQDRPQLAEWHKAFSRRTSYVLTEHDDSLQGGSPLTGQGQ